MDFHESRILFNNNYLFPWIYTQYYKILTFSTLHIDFGSHIYNIFGVNDKTDGMFSWENSSLKIANRTRPDQALYSPNYSQIPNPKIISNPFVLILPGRSWVLNIKVIDHSWV